MNKSFIEVYDNALPNDLCDYIVSIFEKERNSPYSKLRESQTALEPEGGNVYVSGMEMKLNSDNYIFDTIVSELDYVVMNKIFDYNKKYYVWSPELNMDLIPTEEEKRYAEEEVKSPEMLNTMINRMGEFILKGYTAPDDGYYAYHNDWSTSPTLISRVLGAQFFLNDVEKGGETEFYHQDMKIKPKKGRLVVWPVGFTHTHRGNKPISNNKYITTCFLTLTNLFV